MMFPLDFLDISLLLAVIAIILLITSEMLSSYSGKVNILINKKKLRISAITISVLFLLIVAMRIINMILTP